MTGDGHLNHSPMKPFVVCHSQRKLVCYFFCLTYNACHSVFFMKWESKKYFGIFGDGTKKRRGKFSMGRKGTNLAYGTELKKELLINKVFNSTYNDKIKKPGKLSHPL